MSPASRAGPHDWPGRTNRKGPISAHAETSTDVQKQVDVLLDRIRDLQKQAALLAQAYDKSLDQVRASMSGDAEADRAVDDLSLTARLSQARLSGRVRGLYMAGGPLAVYSTLMSSGSLVDLADRTAMAERVLQADMFQASRATVCGPGERPRQGHLEGRHRAHEG